MWERSGLVVECLTRDLRAVCWSLTGVTVNPSLVLAQPRKTRPCLTERLLMGRKESNQANKQKFQTFQFSFDYIQFEM